VYNDFQDSGLPLFCVFKSINQNISVAPYAASESEAHDDGNYQLVQFISYTEQFSRTTVM